MRLSGALGKLDLLSAIADKRSNLSWGKKRISLSWYKSLAGDTDQPRRSGADLTQTNSYRFSASIIAPPSLSILLKSVACKSALILSISSLDDCCFRAAVWGSSDGCIVI